MDGRGMIANAAEHRRTYEEATRIARGESRYLAPGIKVIGNLRGGSAGSVGGGSWL